jgi:hypothetical protein
VLLTKRAVIAGVWQSLTKISLVRIK